MNWSIVGRWAVIAIIVVLAIVLALTILGGLGHEYTGGGSDGPIYHTTMHP